LGTDLQQGKSESPTGNIGRTIQESPFDGDGHRKVSAWLRVRGERTSIQRVLRLTPEHELLPPQRQPQLAEPKRHEGTIVTERPNQMWGIDATAGFTLQDRQVPIFAMIDHRSAYWLGLHAAKRRTRSGALEPMRQAVLEPTGGFPEGIAAGVKLRHDRGSQSIRDDFQREIRSTRQRTLARRTASLPILAAGPSGPACPRACRMTIIQKTVQEIQCGTTVRCQLTRSSIIIMQKVQASVPFTLYISQTGGAVQGTGAFGSRSCARSQSTPASGHFRSTR
jgi:hypothetical protein